MTVAATTPLMTADEFIRDYGGEPGHELVRGCLEWSPVPGFNHDAIEGNTVALLHAFAKSLQLGRVTCGETLIRVQTNPDTFRGADVAFVSYAKWPKDQPRSKGPMLFPPDLVVEIHSPSDRPGAIEEKTKEYLAAGVTVVITLDPDLESVSVHRLNEIDQRFHNGDTVTLPDVLPGFAVPVKAFFE